jgi:hypothetical protein
MNAAGSKKKHGAAERSWRDEFDLVRRPALLFAAVLGSALLVVGAVSWVAAEKHDALAQATRVREHAFARLNNVASEEQDIRAFQPRFLALQAAGLIGSENRLAWIEALRQAQRERKLPSVTYDIEPQQAVTMDQPFGLGDYQLRGSRMQLHLALVHELDLFTLLADLRSAGLFTVEQCKLTRAMAQPDAGAAPRVLGECTLVWLSLAAPPSTKAMP